MFLDMLKKIWQSLAFEGLLFKLKHLVLSGKYCWLINFFLRNRQQRVVFNGQSFKWSPIKAGVAQGSILGPLFFLVYINDLRNRLLSNPKLFADYTSIFSVVKHHSLTKLNEDLSKLSQWAYQWKTSFILMFPNRLKKLFFAVRKTSVIILLFSLIISK